ncbi:MAG: ornithine carbamoyltransferase [Opitutales bacterium]
MPQHFLAETDTGVDALPAIFAQTRAMKANRAETPAALKGQSWGLLFFKKSTRTRVSFQVGVHELGAQPVVLNTDDLQISRGESVADTARVLGRYLHGLIIRCYEHAVLEAFAAESGVPVVNALSDFLHPCQVYADAFTLAERLDPGTASSASLKGRTLAFFGDTACNVANSLVIVGAMLEMRVLLCGPAEAKPSGEVDALIAQAGMKPTWQQVADPKDAARQADALYTDVWVSMGKENEAAARNAAFQPYQVTRELLDLAGPDAVFLHCLPAKVGKEIGEGVLEHPKSVIFDQAENRLHVQKAILAHIAGQ